MAQRYHATLRIRPHVIQRHPIARPGFFAPLAQGQAMTLYLRTGMRLSSAIVALGITLVGIVFVGLWFITNI